MKKSVMSIAFASTVLCTCLSLQSCADTTRETYVGTPYGPSYVTDTYSPYQYPYAYNTYSTYDYPYDNTYSYPYPSYYSAPNETYYTTRTEPDSVVGSTAHAVGTIIAAPFRLVGDAIGIIL